MSRLTVFLCLLVASWPAAAGTAPPVLDPGRVGWSAIELGGSKLFVSADARLDWSIVPAAEVAGRLRPPPGLVGVPPGDAVLQLVYEGRAAGRRSRAVLWMDPVTGAALQRMADDLTGDLRHRDYRYTTTGGYHWTRWPERGEEKLPWAQWSRATEGFRPYGREPAGPVLESTGLIYAIAAAPLLRPGDTADFSIFQRRVLQRIEVRVADTRRIDVDYREVTAAGSRRQRGGVEALRIVVRGDPGTSGSSDELELLGLRGALELHLDPATRAPLSLSGDVKIIGAVTLRLNSLQRFEPLAPGPQSP
jgi:hypothetical protein